MTITDEFQREIVLLHAQICQGLADPKRILILYALADRPCRVSDLTELLGLPQPTVSHHLKILRERGLVTIKQEGSTIYYTLADNRVIQALDLLREVLRDRLIQQANLFQQF